MHDNAIAPDQYLTFSLGSELYALHISSVREIIDNTDITRMPDMPDHMRGVINLRGHAVPVMDLHQRFRIGETAFTPSTCVIITEIPCDDGLLVMGVLTDAVQEVIELAADHIDPPPRMGVQIDTGFIQGMGRVEDRFVVILDIRRVLLDYGQDIPNPAAGAASLPEPQGAAF